MKLEVVVAYEVELGNEITREEEPEAALEAIKRGEGQIIRTEFFSALENS